MYEQHVSVYVGCMYCSLARKDGRNFFQLLTKHQPAIRMFEETLPGGSACQASAKGVRAGPGPGCAPSCAAVPADASVSVSTAAVDAATLADFAQSCGCLGACCCVLCRSCAAPLPKRCTRLLPLQQLHPGAAGT